MKDCTEYWCPIARRPCREDCAWLDIRYTLDDEGVGRSCYCAVGVIASAMQDIAAPGEHSYV